MSGSDAMPQIKSFRTKRFGIATLTPHIAFYTFIFSYLWSPVLALIYFWCTAIFNKYLSVFIWPTIYVSPFSRIFIPVQLSSFLFMHQQPPDSFPTGWKFHIVLESHKDPETSAGPPRMRSKTILFGVIVFLSILTLWHLAHISSIGPLPPGMWVHHIR